MILEKSNLIPWILIAMGCVFFALHICVNVFVRPDNFGGGSMIVVDVDQSLELSHIILRDSSGRFMFGRKDQNRHAWITVANSYHIVYVIQPGGRIISFERVVSPEAERTLIYCLAPGTGLSSGSAMVLHCPEVQKGGAEFKVEGVAPDEHAITVILSLIDDR